jgi:hypothetical protein
LFEDMLELLGRKPSFYGLSDSTRWNTHLAARVWKTSVAISGSLLNI